MYNLFEIMQSAQNGEAMRNLARQFGLDPDQAQRAVEALLPAFSLGLQRNAQNPQNFFNTLGLMGSGQYARFFEQPGATANPNAYAQGNDVLSHLFGGPEVSRQVAAQAAAMTGIGTDIMKRMLPVIATMIIGGLSKAASQQGMGGMLGQIAEAMQRGGMGAGGMGFPGFPGGQAGSAQQPGMNPMDPTGAFGGLIGSVLGSFFGAHAGAMAGAQAGAEAGSRMGAPAAPQPSASDASANFDPAQFGLDSISRMFETGRAAQAEHVQTMQSIFDTFLGVAPKEGQSGTEDEQH